MKVHDDKTYSLDDMDSLIKGLIQSIEKDTELKVFTLRVLGDAEDDNKDAIIVFEDKSMMRATLSVEILEDGKLAFRVRGYFI